jgi:hypothetical protein
MKKMLTVALLLASALISSASFAAPVKDPAPAPKTTTINGKLFVPLSWPITGSYGSYTYVISSTSWISFYKNGVFVRSFNFFQNFPATTYSASITGTVANETGLFSATLAIYANGTQYNLDLNGL